MANKIVSVTTVAFILLVAGSTEQMKLTCAEVLKQICCRMRMRIITVQFKCEERARFLHDCVECKGQFECLTPRGIFVKRVKNLRICKPREISAAGFLYTCHNSTKDERSVACKRTKNSVTTTEKKVSSGVLAGIVVAAVAGTAVVTSLAVFLLLKRGKQLKCFRKEKNDENVENEGKDGKEKDSVGACRNVKHSNNQNRPAVASYEQENVVFDDFCHYDTINIDLENFPGKPSLSEDFNSSKNNHPPIAPTLGKLSDNNTYEYGASGDLSADHSYFPLQLNESRSSEQQGDQYTQPQQHEYFVLETEWDNCFNENTPNTNEKAVPADQGQNNEYFVLEKESKSDFNGNALGISDVQTLSTLRNDADEMSMDAIASHHQNEYFVLEKKSQQSPKDDVPGEHE